LQLADGSQESLQFTIEDKEYVEQHLTITNNRQVNPNADDMIRINRESAEMNRAFSSWDDSLTPVFSMQPPVAGIKSSSFGLKRFFNGRARNPHSGMDIAADEGPIPVDNKLVVTRTRDGGRSFESLAIGSPQDHSYDLIHRHRVEVDAAGDTLMMGSTSGNLWVSEDSGDSWRALAANLADVYCVKFGQL